MAAFSTIIEPLQGCLTFGQPHIHSDNHTGLPLLPHSPNNSFTHSHFHPISFSNSSSPPVFSYIKNSSLSPNLSRCNRDIGHKTPGVGCISSGVFTGYSKVSNGFTRWLNGCNDRRPPRWVRNKPRQPRGIAVLYVCCHYICFMHVKVGAVARVSPLAGIADHTVRIYNPHPNPEIAGRNPPQGKDWRYCQFYYSTFWCGLGLQTNVCRS